MSGLKPARAAVVVARCRREGEGERGGGERGEREGEREWGEGGGREGRGKEKKD